jgi:hypothetical protein
LFWIADCFASYSPVIRYKAWAIIESISHMRDRDLKPSFRNLKLNLDRDWLRCACYLNLTPVYVCFVCTSLTIRQALTSRLISNVCQFCEIRLGLTRTKSGLEASRNSVVAARAICTDCRSAHPFGLRRELALAYIYRLLRVVARVLSDAFHTPFHVMK